MRESRHNALLPQPGHPCAVSSRWERMSLLPPGARRACLRHCRQNRGFTCTLSTDIMPTIAQKSNGFSMKSFISSITEGVWKSPYKIRGIFPLISAAPTPSFLLSIADNFVFLIQYVFSPDLITSPVSGILSNPCKNSIRKNLILFIIPYPQAKVKRYVLKFLLSKTIFGVSSRKASSLVKA